MPEARISAQAKVNLRLKVLAREADGYHSLETIFARIDLADDVVVRTGGLSQSIDTKGADLGPGDRNLAYRAALAYKEATGWPINYGVEVPTAQIDQVELSCLEQDRCRHKTPGPANESHDLERV